MAKTADRDVAQVACCGIPRPCRSLDDCASDFQASSAFHGRSCQRSANAPAEGKKKIEARRSCAAARSTIDLLDARDAAGDTDTAVVRIEQIYPFPGEPLVERLKRMTALEEVVWAQEEPKNNGAWFFVEPFIEEALAAAASRVGRARYAGRKASASPATGLAKRHQAEQAALVADALGHNVRGELRRQRTTTTTAQPVAGNPG